MRARLRGNRHSLSARLREERQCIGGRNVDDVNVRPELAAEAEEHRDRFHFRLRRTRVEPRRVFRRIGIWERIPQRLRRFRVHEQRQAAAREDRQREPQMPFGDVRKFVHARRGKKTFEAAHAGIGKRVELAGIAWNDAAPELHVDPRRPRRRPLRCERLDIRCRRNAVERHVDDRSHAAGCSRCTGGGEAFPTGASWIVDVDVGVDESRENDS